MGWKYYLFAWGSAMFALISAVKTALELYSLIGDPQKLYLGDTQALFRWFIAFVVSIFISLFIREIKIHQIRSKARIKVADFGMDIKSFDKGHICYGVYVDFFNKTHKDASNANANNVYAQIEQEIEDGKGISSNPGRWFIPNEDKVGSIGLQTVDLLANGHPRRLHFAIAEPKSKHFSFLWRTDDGYTVKSPLKKDSFVIKATLKSDGGAIAEYRFELEFIKGKKWYDSVARITHKKDTKSYPLKDLQMVIKDNKKK